MNYPTARDEQAAYWYLRLQDADITAEEIQEGLRWQRACRENQEAFDRIQAFWRAWPEGTQRSARQPTTRWVAIAAALAIALVGGWWFVSTRPSHDALVAHEYATGVGQVRTIRLEEGSQIVLGGDTSIRTSFSQHARQLTLTRGEAIFHVSKDASRPFTVSSAEGSARAVGTMFDVHRGPEGVTVTVIEGIVAVQPPTGADNGMQLHRGDQVSLSPAGQMSHTRHVNVEQVTSWRTGRKVFVDQSLASVVADLNRYSLQPITLAPTDAAAAVRVTGTVKVDGIRDWLNALGPVIGVNVIEDERGIVLTTR